MVEDMWETKRPPRPPQVDGRIGKRLRVQQPIVNITIQDFCLAAFPTEISEKNVMILGMLVLV
jgi:hypothetical protein